MRGNQSLPRKQTPAEQEKEDALALAELIYDVFTENELNARIMDGQDNAESE